MNQFLNQVVEWIAKVHSYLMKLNDQYETNFTDKQLHFLVIGLVGMGLVFLIYPLFKWLAKKHVMVITWIYVFTLVLVLTFAIEIGQGLTKTGVMEFGDIVFGVFGFIMLFIVFCCFRAIYHIIRKLIRKHKEKKEEMEEAAQQEIQAVEMNQLPPQYPNQEMSQQPMQMQQPVQYQSQMQVQAQQPMQMQQPMDYGNYQVSNNRQNNYPDENV